MVLLNTTVAYTNDFHEDFCPACTSKQLHEITEIEHEINPRTEEETGRIRPVLKYLLCENCGRQQIPVKTMPLGEWYYPAAM